MYLGARTRMGARTRGTARLPSVIVEGDLDVSGDTTLQSIIAALLNTSNVVTADLQTETLSATDVAALSGGGTLGGGFSLTGDLTAESGVQVFLDPGAVGAPGLAVRTDVDTGIYLASDGNFNVATAGAVRANFSSTGALITGLLRGSLGLSFGSGANLTPVAGTSLLAQGLVELNPTAGNVTMTATPNIAAASIGGQCVVYLNRHATNSVTIRDESALAGSNVRTIGAADCVIGPGDVVVFVRGAADGYWRQAAAVAALAL